MKNLIKKSKLVENKLINILKESSFDKTSLNGNAQMFKQWLSKFIKCKHLIKVQGDTFWVVLSSPSPNDKELIQILGAAIGADENSFYPYDFPDKDQLKKGDIVLRLWWD